MLPPEERLVGAQLHRYIGDELYWVLHAPRQTGKTTFLQSWMREINGGTQAVACYVSVERCQGIGEPEKAMPAICNAIVKHANEYAVPAPRADTADPASALNGILVNWAELLAPKPLIVLFDEVDVLTGETLISFLRQLRDGFAGRGVGKFPVSIALVGMRDLKDYLAAAKGGAALNPGSPFNVKEDSAVLSNFVREDIARLFAQRTGETGQGITAEALDYVYDQSKGQPWIVNSLFKRATLRVLDGESRETVRVEHLEAARRQMIEARETHLDALGERLRDPRIRQVVQTIITGETNLALSRTNPAVELSMDLGLVAWSSETGFIIANPIYEEILTRFLDAPYHDNLPLPKDRRWELPNGALDMDALLRDFQSFWRDNSEVWEQAADYPEAFPHLLLMAFLQRITNGAGRIEREYAAGRGRIDLAVEYRGSWDIIEIKLLRQGRSFEALAEEGTRQILGYRDNFSKGSVPEGLRAGDGSPAKCYLLIFDRRQEKLPWERRIKWIPRGDVTILGL